MKKKVIGITGSIGSGKSTVSRHLKNLGFEIIDCDKISHEMLLPNNQGHKLVTNEFGSDILDELGYIVRKKLGDIVFSCEEKREKLNEILHPLIKDEVKRKINNCKDELVFIDCPLLFETDFYKLCDYTICVYVDMDNQIRRIMQRDNVNFPAAINKINAQMPLKNKVNLADFVIDNNYQESDLDWQLNQLLKNLMKKGAGL